MSRRDRERLEDVLVATAAITVHMGRGSLDDGLVFDAVRVRLIEIGEAVKGIAPELLAEERSASWTSVCAAAIAAESWTGPSAEPAHPAAFKIGEEPGEGLLEFLHDRPGDKARHPTGPQGRAIPSWRR